MNLDVILVTRKEGVSVEDKLWMRQDWRQGDLLRGC